MSETPFIKHFAVSENPLDLQSYVELGGTKGLTRVLKGTPEQALRTVADSGLRGRGGAGFDTGKKWASVSKVGEPFVVCNADEGEPGTFKDRFILEKAPYLVIEGMTIAAYAVGAREGVIYIRGEYPKIVEDFEQAVAASRAAGLLGKTICGSSFEFDIAVKKGGGSYVVGDETALLNSIMGNRGYPWLKPPFPTEKGLWDRPTVVNNVETLSYVPLIAERGAAAFRTYGPKECPGPKLFCVSGHVRKPGVFELPMGTRVSELIDAAGGVAGNLKAVQIGGTAGPVYDNRALDFALDYSSMQRVGGALGSGAVVVMNSTVNMVHVLEVVARFFSEESCGQCFPCRYGTRQLEYMANKIAAGEGTLAYLDRILETVEIMNAASFCPFGQSVALPIRTLYASFRSEIEAFIKQQQYVREAI